jgi:hypothetical protein
MQGCHSQFGAHDRFVPVRKGSIPEAPLGGHSTQLPLLLCPDDLPVPAATLWLPADAELPLRPPNEPDPAADEPVDPPVPVELEFAVLAELDVLDVLVPVVAMVVAVVVVVVVVVDGCRIGRATALPPVG